MDAHSLSIGHTIDLDQLAAVNTIPGGLSANLPLGLLHGSPSSARNRRQAPNGASSWYHRWSNGATMRKLIFSLFLLALSNPLVSAQQFDLVLEGGRVMDPETGVDAVRNVGVRDGKIVRISSEALSGRRVVHASGLVVAPGFIDLHQHGQDLTSQRVKGCLTILCGDRALQKYFSCQCEQAAPPVFDLICLAFVALIEILTVLRDCLG